MKYLLLLILLFSFSEGFTQTDSSGLTLTRIFRGDIIDFTIDNLGNVYTISKNNQLKKYNANGDSIAVYNDVRRFGSIYSLDASNPMKLLLYHKNFGTIVTLDRFLNARNTIDLRRLNIFQVKAIGQSYDNGIWVYDEQEAKLKKVNDEGDLVSETADFRLFIDPVPLPVQLIDDEKLVHLYDPKAGVYIFDYFGTLKNKVPLLGWEDVHVVKGIIFGRKNDKLEQYQPGTLSLKERHMGNLFSGVDRVKISLSSIYCLKEGIISVYSF